MFILAKTFAMSRRSFYDQWNTYEQKTNITWKNQT